MKQILAETGNLLWKEIKLELRLKYALNSLLLFTGSIVFICYLTFINIIDKHTWNTLFWIILLFSAVNSIAKTFVQEGESRNLYYYFQVKPISIILSKQLYNTALLLVISCLALILYSLVLGNPVEDIILFCVAVILGVIGLTIPLTMVSAIASKASNNPTLMAILSFPIVIPVLMMSIKLSKIAIDGLDRSVASDEILTLISLNAIVFVLSLILYPYLWKS
ncbi:MAG: heme exporter protein CcmB [bacterium]|nr:heme exporter protein CcmB [bacterium]